MIKRPNFANALLSLLQWRKLSWTGTQRHPKTCIKIQLSVQTEIDCVELLHVGESLTMSESAYLVDLINMRGTQMGYNKSKNILWSDSILQTHLRAELLRNNMTCLIYYLFPLRCHFRSRVMEQTALFVRIFFSPLSSGVEPALVMQTWICLGSCHVIHLPRGASTHDTMRFDFCLCLFIPCLMSKTAPDQDEKPLHATDCSFSKQEFPSYVSKRNNIRSFSFREL